MFNISDIKKEEREKEKEEKKRSRDAIHRAATPEQELKKVQEEKITLEEERVYRKGVVSVRDIIAPQALEVNPSFIKLNNKFARTIFVINYPRYISVGWFAPVINLNTAIDVSMFFYPVKAEIILKQLKNKVGVLEAQLSADREKGAPRDPIRETALRDIEELRDQLTQGIEHFFQFALYITLYADTKEELDKLTGDLESLFGGKLVYSKKVLYQAEQGFNATLPLCNDELQITFNMNTSPCASSFPFVSSELTSDSGILYGINRHNNSLILFDRFSMQNANMVVFATSGAGKSYAIKLEILRSLMMGADVIVIDPEKEYKHLSDAAGGSYVNISLNSASKINPFDLPRPGDEEVNAGDIIRTAVITLKGLLRIMLGALTHQEDSLIDRALLETYGKKDITADSILGGRRHSGMSPSYGKKDITADSILGGRRHSGMSPSGELEPPIMQDLQQILEGMEGGEDLAMRLKKYTEGTFSGLINSPTNIEMDNQLVVFSVRDLEDELRPIAIYTIVNYIWNVVRSKLKKRILVIDEAWWLMQNEDSAKFIFALVKRCRKYYLGVTTITQDVNDFLISPYGQAIVNNSALQLLLKQSPAAIDLVQKTFILTQGEKYLLLECAVGEGIFFAGSKHAAIKVIASYTEDQLITSDPRQILELEAAKKEFEDALKQTDGHG